eukprot:scaffold126150_cov60-Attheya_sp.AAC.9
MSSGVEMPSTATSSPDVQLHNARTITEGDASDNANANSDLFEDEIATTDDESVNNLGLWSASALLTADCLGTGILALPHAVKVLGVALGVGFIILNLPINLYAGTILSRVAQHVEQTQEPALVNNGRVTPPANNHDETHVIKSRKHAYSSVDQRSQINIKNNVSFDHEEKIEVEESPDDIFEDTPSPICNNDLRSKHDKDGLQLQKVDEDGTCDFIGLTEALMSRESSWGRWATKSVLVIYYTNIFLVLGNYILVMSHAVSAFLGEDNICLPKAGIIASTLMFALSQLRTMSKLGRSASIISLTALFIVVVQCLMGIQENTNSDQTSDSSTTVESEENKSPSLLRQLAAISSIGFAVGSQKLLLNIRHEMKDRTKVAPGSLGISLALFGTAYVTVCLLSGPDPPSFLFDAIGPGWHRQLAGFLLWVHVAVSYAINSQALCSSIERLLLRRQQYNGTRVWPAAGTLDPRWQWGAVTLCVAITSYLVANAVPFFKDLVALIGALTSIPLTLLLPAIFYRHVMQVPMMFFPSSRESIPSFLLLVFSIVFLLCGLFGALGSIKLDWAHHGPPFACG